MTHSKDSNYNIELLITSGCSFSDPVHVNSVNHSGEKQYTTTWPLDLERYLNCKSIHRGHNGNGQGLISRTIIYEVEQLLHNKQDLSKVLIGIMWSGPSRTEMYSLYPPIKDLVLKDDPGAWTQLGGDDKFDEAVAHYRFFQDQCFYMIKSLEHILRTQWILEKYNIKYFMAQYMSSVLDDSWSYENPNLKHLWDLINHDTFINKDINLYDWTKNKSSFMSDDHPSSQAHHLFTEEIIIPYLKDKKLI